MEKNYSKREQDYFREELFKRMDKQDNMLERIEGQTTKTNGRVTRVEDKIADYDTYKITVDDYKKEKVKIYTVILVGMAFIGALGTLFYALINSKLDNRYKDLDNRIDTAVSAALDERHLELIEN